MDIYRNKGYRDRKDYLDGLAEEFGPMTYLILYEDMHGCEL